MEPFNYERTESEVFHMRAENAALKNKLHEVSRALTQATRVMQREATGHKTHGLDRELHLKMKEISAVRSPRTQHGPGVVPARQPALDPCAWAEQIREQNQRLHDKTDSDVLGSKQVRPERCLGCPPRPLRRRASQRSTEPTHQLPCLTHAAVQTQMQLETRAKEEQIKQYTAENRKIHSILKRVERQNKLDAEGKGSAVAFQVPPPAPPPATKHTHPPCRLAQLVHPPCGAAR